VNQKFFLVLIIILTSSFANESDTSAIKWQWEEYRALYLSFTPSLASSVEGGGSTAFTLADAYLQLPIIRKVKNYLGAGALYRATAPEIYGALSDTLQLSTKVSHTAHLLLAYNRTVSPTMHVYAEYNGGINGIWDDFGKSHSHLGFFYIGYTHKKNIYFRGGAAVAYLFGEPQFYPVLGAAIGISDRFAIDLLVPKHVLFRFKASKKVEIGTRIAYTLGNAGFNVEYSDLQLNYSFSQVSSSIYTDYRIVKDLIVRAEIGGYLLRKVKLIDLNSNDDYLEVDVNETPFISISLRWQV
jgi:hypothetical protein